MSVFQQIGTLIGGPTLSQYGGEDVTYTPFGGSPTTIKAVVNREPLNIRSADGSKILQYEFTITVEQAVIPSLNVGGDKIALKKRLTDAATASLTITRVLSQEGGMYRLALL